MSRESYHTSRLLLHLCPSRRKRENPNPRNKLQLMLKSSLTPNRRHWCTLRTEKMRNHSWLRKNWLWVAGGAFLGIHLGTWALQKVTKNSVRYEQQLRNKGVSED